MSFRFFWRFVRTKLPVGFLFAFDWLCYWKAQLQPWLSYIVQKIVWSLILGRFLLIKTPAQTAWPHAEHKSVPSAGPRLNKRSPSRREAGGPSESEPPFVFKMSKSPNGVLLSLFFWVNSLRLPLWSRWWMLRKQTAKLGRKWASSFLRSFTDSGGLLRRDSAGHGATRALISTSAIMANSNEDD